MRKIWICAGLLVSCAINSPAQIPSPGAEIFGGYSYTRVDSGGGFNANGWEGSVTGNFNRSFGLEADFSQHYATPPAVPANGNSFFGPHSNGFTFLFGPHFAFRAIPRVNPFVHFLVGGTRGTATFEGPIPICQVVPPFPPPAPRTQTSFTTAAGGGVDVKATRFIWIRVIQVDYLRQFFSNDGQNNVRVSAGIVFRFGT
ncbi:MAG TPA: outer membrane beta-barrel protein [Terriglobia bacterium]|nr:outer membrane beta-barrel protein [Terriglobia bacterium]